MSTSKETVSKPRNKTKKRERGVGIYMKNAIARKVHLPFNVIGENLKENIEKTLQTEIEGRCIDEPPPPFSLFHPFLFDRNRH